eukprot:2890046-Amphidinium_carterae.1
MTALKLAPESVWNAMKFVQTANADLCREQLYLTKKPTTLNTPFDAYRAFHYSIMEVPALSRNEKERTVHVIVQECLNLLHNLLPHIVDSLPGLSLLPVKPTVMNVTKNHI